MTRNQLPPRTRKITAGEPKTTGKSMHKVFCLDCETIAEPQKHGVACVIYFVGGLLTMWALFGFYLIYRAHVCTRPTCPACNSIRVISANSPAAARAQKGK